MFRPLIQTTRLPFRLRPTAALPSPIYLSTSIHTTAPRPTILKPQTLDAAESRVWDILTSEFSPTILSVEDVSGGCGSMYAIEIASEKFKGLSMLKQQRLVNAALGDMVKGWHGLRLHTQAA